MAINSSEDLASVYLAAPIEERARQPLYQSVRELALRHTATGHILDIGCSDGVATYGMEDVTVFGMDLNEASLKEAKRRDPNYRALCGDMRHLPLAEKETGHIDTVLLLDILEHEPYGDTLQFLKGLRSSLRPDHSLIVSMPVISPLSVETWREGLLALRAGKRPPTGLFDRTHKILTGRRGHLSLLGQAGYEVVEEHQTNHLVGVTGEWGWCETQPFEPPDVASWVESQGFSLKSKAIVQFVYTSLRKTYQAAHASNSVLAQRASEAMVAYQGLYVMKPQLPLE